MGILQRLVRITQRWQGRFLLRRHFITGKQTRAEASAGVHTPIAEPARNAQLQE
jgi:hypothetical protein